MRTASLEINEVNIDLIYDALDLYKGIKDQSKSVVHRIELLMDRLEVIDTYFECK